jgi:hypothetical protein
LGTSVAIRALEAKQLGTPRAEEALDCLKSSLGAEFAPYLSTAGIRELARADRVS